MTYTLNITIDPASVAQIHAARQYVTIVQLVQTDVQGESLDGFDPASVAQIHAARQEVTIVQSGQTDVQGESLDGSDSTPEQMLTAWLSIPAAQSTIITWSPAYELYATPAIPADGVVLQLNATTSARAGQVYPYQDNQFGSPNQISDRGYFVKNGPKAATTFGLAVAATLAEGTQTTAITAITALPNETVQFQPAASVAVFLSSIPRGGAIFNFIGEPNYHPMSGNSSGDNTVTLTFNPPDGKFYLDTGAAMSIPSPGGVR